MTYGHDAHTAGAEHAAHDHRPGFFTRWLFSTNHKDIGTLYMCLSIFAAILAGGLSVRVEWGKADADDLKETLERQKERPLRIPLPDPARVKSLPPREREQAERVVWTRVSSGYQPEMPRVWFAALYTFYDEAKPDRVFTNSVFWVVTRTNDCFY